MGKSVMANFVQDDTKVLRIEYSPPVDLTGAVFTVTLKASTSTQEAPALKVNHTAGDDPNDNPSGGLVFITLTSAMTSAVPAGTYYGSIKRIMPSGEVTTLIQSGVDGANMVVVYPTLNEVVA